MTPAERRAALVKAYTQAVDLLEAMSHCSTDVAAAFLLAQVIAKLNSQIQSLPNS
jgi:hypothetical protein